MITGYEISCSGIGCRSCIGTGYSVISMTRCGGGVLLARLCICIGCCDDDGVHEILTSSMLYSTWASSRYALFTVMDEHCG